MGRFISALFSVAVIFGSILLTQSALAQTDTYVVSSGSMEPSLEQYDMVVIDRDVPFEEIEVGDIIIFNKPDGADRTILHRVVAADFDAEGNRVLTTKGDANPSPIPGTDYPITEDLYVGKIVNVIPKVGLLAQIIAPPMNYIIGMVVWGVIIYALYKRWKRQKPTELGKNTLMQPPEVHNATEKVAGKNKLTIKNVIPNQKIFAEGGRDFKWSWLIVAIIFVWPAAIAYFLTSKKNSISITISPKSDGQGSLVSVQSMGRRGGVAASELNSTI